MKTTINRLSVATMTVAIAAVFSTNVLASSELNATKPGVKLSESDSKQRRWSLAFDNDLWVPGSRDQDYTYGISAALVGETAPASVHLLNTSLDWVDRRAGLSKPVRYSTEFGLYGFTPEDISRRDANQDDRPYASLLYVSSSREHAGTTPNIAYRSTLTFGVLGLGIVGDLQNGIHDSIGSNPARGWANQISDGGELTARYSIARQRLWTNPNSNVEIKTSAQASIGYLTEASYGVSVRIGRTATRWQSFNPELANYREHSAPSFAGKGQRESYFSTGVAIKVRAYNVFLQGQFRDSAVQLSSDEVNHAIVEAWAGYTHVFRNGYRFSYTLRGHTSEVRRGAGDRNVIWGSLSIAKSF